MKIVECVIISFLEVKYEQQQRRFSKLLFKIWDRFWVFIIWFFWCITIIHKKTKTKNQSFIARVGGDEFIVLLNRTKSVKDSQIVAQNLLNVIKQPIELQTGTVYVGASLGIALFPDHSTDAKTLIDLADHAMYKVKHEGKNNYAYYQESNN